MAQMFTIPPKLAYDILLICIIMTSDTYFEGRYQRPEVVPDRMRLDIRNFRLPSLTELWYL